LDDFAGADGLEFGESRGDLLLDFDAGAVVLGTLLLLLLVIVLVVLLVVDGDFVEFGTFLESTLEISEKFFETVLVVFTVLVSKFFVVGASTFFDLIVEDFVREAV